MPIGDISMTQETINFTIKFISVKIVSIVLALSRIKLIAIPSKLKLTTKLITSVPLAYVEPIVEYATISKGMRKYYLIKCKLKWK